MNQARTERRVVIVDDADAVRTVLRMLLQQAGFAVVGDYGSGANLVQSVQRLKPEIVCLDFGLPGVDGLELLKELRKVCPEVAVIMITASHDLKLEQDAVQAGVAGFIRKPFSPDKILSELKQIVHALDLLRSSRQQQQSMSIAQRKASVLVADDSQIMRSLLCEILGKAGLLVVAEAGDGRQTLELAAEHQPDLVCLDLSMPLMNGMEVLQILRRQNPLTKVLIVTASSSREFIHEAASLGAKGYILKPYQAEKVVQVVERILQG